VVHQSGFDHGRLQVLLVVVDFLLPTVLLIFVVVLFLFSSLTAEVTPSFILLAIQGNKVVTYVYELHGDQVDVSKSEFSKA
jgi:hypothetical protein